jgi:hypothetical protein
MGRVKDRRFNFDALSGICKYRTDNVGGRYKYHCTNWMLDKDKRFGRCDRSICPIWATSDTV